MKNKIILYVVLIVIISAGAVMGAYYYINALYPTPASSMGVFAASETGRAAINNVSNSNFDAAISETQLYITSHPKDTEALLFLAATYGQRASVSSATEKSQYADKAIDASQRVLSLDAKNAEAYRIIGYGHQIKQEYSVAFEAYNKSISLNPNADLTFASRGQAYRLSGDYVKAESDFKTALSINQKNQLALIGLASVDVLNGNNTKAQALLEKLLASGSENIIYEVQANILLGNISEQTSVKDARAYYTQALAIEPQNPLIITLLARVKYADILNTTLSSKGKDPSIYPGIQDVIADFNASLALNPNMTLTYFSLGKVSEGLQDTAKATSYLETASAKVATDSALDASEKISMQQKITAELNAIKK